MRRDQHSKLWKDNGEKRPRGMTFYVTIRSLESRELGPGERHSRVGERGNYWVESRVLKRKENILIKKILKHILFKINRPGLARAVLSTPL